MLPLLACSALPSNVAAVPPLQRLRVSDNHRSLETENGLFSPEHPGHVRAFAEGPGQRGDWRRSLNATGATQLKHLRALMESRPFLTRIPDQTVMAGDPLAGNGPLQAARDTAGTRAIVYSPAGRPVNARLDNTTGPKVKEWWFNPRTGDATVLGDFASTGEREFTPPTSGADHDWVLVLDDAAKLFPPPGQANGKASGPPAAAPSSAAGLDLGIDGPAFTLNGKKTFMLGASYYGALGAPDDFILRDLDDLRALGFNWIRVFAVWDMFDHDVSAVDITGKAREPYLAKLKAVITAAEQRGMVVDVTLCRMACLPKQEAHLRAVDTLAKALKGCRNVYFDLANERDQNYAGGTFVSYAELKALRDRVKAADPDRLVTASGEPTDRADLARYLVETGLDFISPHLNRDAGTEKRTAEATRKFLGWMKELDRVAPIHYQEPFRRDYLDYRGYWQPEAETFCTDLRNAKLGGAAGWCFHKGSPSPPERFPEGNRRSFDLWPSQGRLMEQLDAVERQFLKRAAACVQ